MKQVFLSFLAALFLFSGLTAQEDADKMLRKASRNVANYNLDPSANADKLDEAIGMIEQVVKDAEFSKSAEAWQVYGSAFNTKTSQEVIAMVQDPEAVPSDERVALKAYKGFSKALEFAVKNYEVKDAITGLEEIINNLNYIASRHYQQSNFAIAYEHFDAVMKAHELLKKNDGKTPFEDQKAVHDQLFYVGLTAMTAEKMDAAKEAFTKLQKENYENAAVYEALYRIKREEGDAESARMLLAEGREKFPEDQGLMYAEINDALAEGRLEELTDKLAIAMERDPENVSIPVTLGNVHDQLFQKYLAEGDKEKAQEHYSKAKLYYGKALEIDPENKPFDAVYSLGALEYNKAAHLSQEVNELSEDFTPAGTKKYDAKKAEMMTQFDMALPYFIESEQLNPNDLNTLLALREIYARQEKFDLSNEYKAKIEAIQAGGGSGQ